MKVLLIAVFALVSTSLFAQQKVAEVAEFSTENFNFGQIKQGVPATATFTVKNIGDKPLIIEQATPSCGCTVGSFTKEPVMPGETGTITAVFNAAALGNISKTITVKLADIQDVKFLKLSGEVLSAEAYAKVQKGLK